MKDKSPMTDTASLAFRKASELINQSPVPSVLSDPQVGLLTGLYVS